MAKLLPDIKNLSLDFITEGKRINALKNITMSVTNGEILAIVGESDSDKSVAALSILQLLPTPPAIYHSGEIGLTINTETKRSVRCKQKQKSLPF